MLVLELWAWNTFMECSWNDRRWKGKKVRRKGEDKREKELKERNRKREREKRGEGRRDTR